MLPCERVGPVAVLSSPVLADGGFEAANEGGTCETECNTEARPPTRRRNNASLFGLPKTICCLRGRGAASAICKRRESERRVVLVLPLLLGRPRPREGDTKAKAKREHERGKPCCSVPNFDGKCFQFFFFYFLLLNFSPLARASWLRPAAAETACEAQPPQPSRPRSAASATTVAASEKSSKERRRRLL